MGNNTVKTYKSLLDALLELQEKNPQALENSITIKQDDEYFGIQDMFIHFDSENPTGEGVVEEGTPVLECY